LRKNEATLRGSFSNPVFRRHFVIFSIAALYLTVAAFFAYRISGPVLGDLLNPFWLMVMYFHSLLVFIFIRFRHPKTS
jgi:hypothetical protein